MLMHPNEARIVVSALAGAPLRVCEVGTTFSRHWRGGCMRLSRSGREIRLPTSGGAVHVGFTVAPAGGRSERAVRLEVRWHCVDHFFLLQRRSSVIASGRPRFEC
jgi:hypothetical protein